MEGKKVDRKLNEGHVLLRKLRSIVRPRISTSLSDTQQEEGLVRLGMSWAEEGIPSLILASFIFALRHWR